MSVGLLTVWSALACAGGTPLGDVEYDSFTYGAALDNTQGATLTVNAEKLDTLALLAMGNVLRVTNELGTVSEYFINNLTLDRNKSVATILAKPVEHYLDLAFVRALNAERSSTAVNGTFNAVDWVDQFILPSLAVYGQSWWSLGTISVNGNFTYKFIDQTCMWLVRQLLTNQTAVLVARRNGEVGYYLDLVDLSVATTPTAIVGDNVTALVRVIDDTEQANVIVMAGQTPSGGDEPDRVWYVPWRVGTIAGAVAMLEDPSAQGTTVLGSNGQASLPNMAWRLGCITQPFALRTINGVTNYGLYRAVYILSTKTVWCCFGGVGVQGIQSVNLETRAAGTNQTTSLTTPRDAYYYAATDTLFVVDLGGNRVTPYVTAGPTAGTPIAVGTGPRRIIYITAGGLNRLLVGHTGSGAIKQINPATQTVTATGPAMTTPAHLDSLSDTQVYIASDSADAIYRYNATANTLTTTITNGASTGYTSLAALPSVNEVWACMDTTGATPPVTKITIIDTTSDTVKLTLDVSAVHQAVLDCCVVNGNYYGVTQDGLFVGYSGTTRQLLFAWRHAAWAIGAPLRSVAYLSDLDCFQIGTDTGVLYHVDAQTGGAMIARAISSAAASPGGPNLCLQSQALDQSPWANFGATATANTTTAPDGTLTADTVTRVSSGSDARAQPLNLHADGNKTASYYLKQGTAAANDLAIYDTVVGVYRIQVRVTWSGGIPTAALIGGSGTVYAPVFYNNGWWRIAFTADSVVAANSQNLYVYPSPLGANGETVFVWGVQLEDSPTPTPYVMTTSAQAGGATVTLANSPFPLRQYDEAAFCRSDGEPLTEIPNEASVTLYGPKVRAQVNAQLRGSTNRILNGDTTWYDSSRSVARFLNISQKGTSSEAKWDGYPDPTVLTFTCAVSGAGQVVTAYTPVSINFSSAGAGRVFLPGDIMVGSGADFVVFAKATADGSGNVAIYVTSNSGLTLTNGTVYTVTRPDASVLLANSTSLVVLPQVAFGSDPTGDARSRLYADVNLPFIPGEMTNLYWGITAWTFGFNGFPSDWRLRLISMDRFTALLDVDPNPDTVNLNSRGLVPMSFTGSIPLPLRCAGGHMQFNVQLTPTINSPSLYSLYIAEMWVRVGNGDTGAPDVTPWNLWQLGQDTGVDRGDPLINYTVQPIENDPTNPFTLGALVSLSDPEQGVAATPAIVQVVRTLPKTKDEKVLPVVTLDNRDPSFIRRVVELGAF